MNVGRLIGALVLILVLYAVISQPVDSARMTRNGVSQLGVAGDQLAVFMMSLVGGTRTDGVVPVGGAATGDGSSAP